MANWILDLGNRFFTASLMATDANAPWSKSSVSEETKPLILATGVERRWRRDGQIEIRFTVHFQQPHLSRILNLCKHHALQRRTPISEGVRAASRAFIHSRSLYDTNHFLDSK